MFESLKSLEVTDKTSWCDLPEIGPKARVLVLHAGESNRPYFNAILRRYGKQKAQPKNRTLTPAVMAEARAADKEMFAQYVIMGWEGIPGKNGFVPFQRELAVEFLDSIPDWMFDRIRNHAADVQNFIGEIELPDAEELSGNSESGSVTN